MRRLLFVSDSLDMGGAEWALVNLACALRSDGRAVTIACSRGGELQDVAEEAGVAVRALGTELIKRRFDVAYALGLRKLLREVRPDLVHTHMYASTAATALARVHTPLPQVVTEHSEALWRGRAACAISQWAYRRCNAIIAVSSTIRQRLLLTDGVPGRMTTVVPNCLPTLARGSLPPEFLPEGEPLIGVVARLQPEKGVDIFLHAAALLARSRPRLRFAVVGDGPDRSALEQMARDWGLAGRVVFTGAHPAAAACMSGLAVLVVPSRSEGTPLVVLEAMAAGTPLVASRVGGIPDQVEHGREALLVEPGRPGELAAAIEALLDDPGMRARLAVAARTRVAERFSAAGQLARTLAVYEAVLAPGRTSHRQWIPEDTRGQT